MTASKTTLLYYNGIMWRTVRRPDGTRIVRPFRLPGDARAARPGQAS
jgi:hypothetical protein